MNGIHCDDNDLQEVITPLTVLDTASLHLVRDPSVIDMAGPATTTIATTGGATICEEDSVHGVLCATDATSCSADGARVIVDQEALGGQLTTSTGGAVEPGTAVMVAGTDGQGNATSQVGVVDADGNISLLTAIEAAAITGQTHLVQTANLLQQQQQQQQLDATFNMQQILVSADPQIVQSESVHQASVSTAIPFSIADIVNQTIKDDSDEMISSDIVYSEQEIEEQKKAIYDHPMLPIVNVFFERCELATKICDLNEFDEMMTLSDNFPTDVAKYIEGKGANLTTDNPELDHLMLKTIKVLQIHLLELEKVRELCKDFCNRYICCLKSKLQNEELLHVDGVDDDLDFGYSQAVNRSEIVSENNLETLTTSQGQIIQGNTAMATATVINATASDLCGQQMATVVTTTAAANQQPQLITQSAECTGEPGSQGTIYQMVQTDQGLVATPVSVNFIEQPSPKQISVKKSKKSQKSESGNWDERPSKKTAKVKRGVLPKAATTIMKSWLFQHIIHPYPTEDEKRVISAQTNLSMLQVNNWFINARRRILTPMIASGAAQTKSSEMQAKKHKQPTCTSSRSSSSWLKATQMDNKDLVGQEVSYAAESIVLPSGVTFSTDGQIINIRGEVEEAGSIVVVSADGQDNII